MKAILLAAGYATRLYPITRDRAKPLLDVGGRAEHRREQATVKLDVLRLGPHGGGAGRVVVDGEGDALGARQRVAIGVLDEALVRELEGHGRRDRRHESDSC